MLNGRIFNSYSYENLVIPKRRIKIMKIQHVLVSILSLSFAASTFAASFYGDDKYEIVETPMTWSEADAYAKSKGAILVKIETAEQNTWLKDFLKSVDTTAADGGGAIYSWLGGTDSVAEGTWLWVDGTQVPLNDSGSIWWGNGSGHGAGGSEPDNFNGTQHCLAIGLSGWPSGAPGFYGTAGQWNDINCTNKLTFAIQYPSAKIPQLERDALVALYNSTDGANWKDNTGWMGEVGTECLWYGVTCSSASVTRLSLANNSLTGTIPGELGNLTNLTRLTLNNNSLSGSIPAELGNLSNLKYLWLAVNSLTGSIPNELGNLTKLSELTLSNNDFTGTVPASLNAFNIKSNAFKYEPTDEWPSPYNGVTPNASLGLIFNNVGFFRAADATLYVCLRVFTDGLASSVDGVGKFDIGMKIFSLADATIQITKSREFNTGFYFNEKAELPDCSGKFETTTGVYSDIIQTDTSVLETTWSLVDPVNLILKLESSKDLTAE